MKLSRSETSSLREFNTYLLQGPVSLHDIQVDTISVTDHLGRTLPVPTIFCSSTEVSAHNLPSIHVVACSRTYATQSVHHIIGRYCENYFGSDFIQQGEYMIRHFQDNKVINCIGFPTLARSGMKFEISIIMRQKESFNKICPQCYYSNDDVPATCGWIKWQVLADSLVYSG